MKRYLVTIQARYSNGRYGKHRYFDMEIGANSLREAKENGMQKVKEMTYAEFEKRCEDRLNGKLWGWYYNYSPDELIGGRADIFFSCKVEGMEGDV